MTRRRFIKQLLHSTASAMLLGLTGTSCASRLAAYDTADPQKLAYRPLNGVNMRDLVARRSHHGQGQYLNPFSDIPRGGLGRFLKWKWFSTNQFRKYYADEITQPVYLDPERFMNVSGLGITLLKHAGILIKDDDALILVDPVFGGLFWFIEDFSPLAFNMADLPQPTHILITHGHYDHLDKASLATWGNGTHIVSPPGYDDLFKEIGMYHRTTLDWYDRHFDDGREIIFLPCNHWTMRNPIVGPNTGLWGSYLIRTKRGATLYISGDTAYFDGFEQIGAEFSIDLAIFNLGAYEPRWFMAPSHMNPDETVRAFQALGARHIAIAHWGTFRLGDEPVHFPPGDIQKSLQKKYLENRYIALRHGRTVDYQS